MRPEGRPTDPSAGRRPDESDTRAVARRSVVLVAVAVLALALVAGGAVAVTSDTTSQNETTAPTVLEGERTNDSIRLTFDQAVNVTADTDGFALEVDGTEQPINGAENDSQFDGVIVLNVDAHLLEGENATVSYDGEHDNVVNESSGLEATAFELTLKPTGEVTDATVTTESLETVVYSFEENRVLDRASANVMTQSESTTESMSTTLEQPETVSPASDDRQRVSDPWEHSHDPYQATVQLEMDGGVCTGTLVGDFQVLTAAHCVYDQENGEWVDSVTARPATDRYEWGGTQIKPFSEANAQIVRTYDSFIEGDGDDCSGESCPLEDDMALLTLDRSLGAQEDTHQMQWWPYGADDPVYEEAFIVSQGYPGVPPNSEPYPSMWFDSGDADGEHCVLGYICNEDTVTAELTTTGGQSGAALYHYNSDEDRYEILGVVKGGTEEVTVGPRITYDKSSDLFDWIWEDRDGKYVDPPDDKPNYVFEDFKFTGDDGDWLTVRPTDDVVLGETEVTVEHTVRNVGTATEGPMNIHLYTAEAAGTCELGNRDTYLGTQSFSPPAPYETKSISESTTLPEELGAGTHQVCAIVYSDSDVDEFPEHFEYKHSETRTVSAIEPAEFDVEIDWADTSGGTVLMDYVVENVGDAYGEADIVVEYDGQEQCRDTFSLDGGATEDAICDYDIDEGDPDQLTITVSSPDGYEDQTTVSLEPAHFDIGIDSIDDPVVAGETAGVTVGVENTGDKPATQDITTTHGDCETETISLEGEGDTTVTIDCQTDLADVPDIDITVASDDDTATGTIDVLEPATFELEVESTAVDDGILTVDYRVENTGDVEGTEDVSFVVAGTQEDDATHTLEAGATDWGTFEYELENGDAPELPVELCADGGDCATTEVAIEPATLDLDVVSTNEPVVEGEPLEVTASVTNTGDEPADERVELRRFDGTVVDETHVTLTTSTTIELTWAGTDGAAGTDAITVTSASSSDEREEVTVLESATFDVAIDAYTDPVIEGDDTLAVDATVTNTGEATGTQDISLVVDGDVVATEPNLELEGGESEPIQLDYESQAGDGPELAVAVTSDDDDAERLVDVREQPAFTVSSVDLNDPVVEGDDLVVEAQITNEGDLEGTQTIDVEIDGKTYSSDTLTLEGGDSERVTVTHETETGDAPTLEVEVSTDDDTTGTDATVYEPAEYTVTIDDSNEPVLAGETPLEAAVTIENVGDAPGEKDVVFSVDETETDRLEALELEGGATETTTFTYETDLEDIGTLELAVETPDDEANETATVLEPPSYALEVDEIHDPVDEGEALAVDVTVTNEGATAGERDVELVVDGEVVDAKSALELEPDTTRTITLEYETEHGDAPSVDLEVRSPDDTVTDTATVEEVPYFALESVTMPDGVVANETIEVSAVVTNTGDGTETQTVSLQANETGTDETVDVTLGGGETETVSLNYSTTTDDVPGLDLTVATDDESETEHVRVDTLPTFEVTITDEPETVTAGDPLALDATVENTGTLEGTQTIVLQADGVAQTETDVTVQGGDTETVTLTMPTSLEDAGETLPLTVASENTTDETSVDIVEPEPPNVTVAFLEYPKTVPAGGDVPVTLEVTNTGDLIANQTITVAHDANPDATRERSVELDGGETQQLTVTLPTEPDDAETVTTLSAASANETVTRELSIDEPVAPTFELASLDHPEELEAGNTLTVTAPITNTGTLDGSQTVTLWLDDEPVANRTVDLAAQDTTNVTLEAEVSTAGDRTLAVETANTTETSSLEVTDAAQAPAPPSPPQPDPDPAAFEVSLTDVPETVDAGATVEISALIENVGEEPGTTEVVIGLGDQEMTYVFEDLGGGERETFTVELTAPTATDDAEAFLESGDDRSVTSVSILGATDSSDGDEESADESDTDDDESDADDTDEDDTADEHESTGDDEPADTDSTTPSDDESDVDDTHEFEFDDTVPGFGIGVAIGVLLVISLARARTR